MFDQLPMLRVEDSDRDLLIKLHKAVHTLVLRIDTITSVLLTQGETLSRLDDSVSALTTELDRVLTDVVQSLRDQLAQAQADDSIAAEVAADVEENVARLDELRTRVASFEPAPVEEPPADGEPTPEPGEETP